MGRQHRGVRSPNRQMRRRLWAEAHHDREKDEVVALNNYPGLDVERGEVLLAPGYVNPSLLNR